MLSWFHLNNTLLNKFISCVHSCVCKFLGQYNFQKTTMGANTYFVMRSGLPFSNSKSRLLWCGGGSGIWRSPAKSIWFIYNFCQLITFCTIFLEIRRKWQQRWIILIKNTSLSVFFENPSCFFQAAGPVCMLPFEPFRRKITHCGRFPCFFKETFMHTNYKSNISCLHFQSFGDFLREQFVSPFRKFFTTPLWILQRTFDKRYAVKKNYIRHKTNRVPMKIS